MTILLGFIIIIIFGFWVSSLSGRVAELERRLKHAPGPAHGTQPAYPVSAPPPPPPLSSDSVAWSASEIVPNKTDSEQETEIATGWLNKIGVVALVLGVGFFFKYAIDQGWINEWARVVIGFAISGLLVYLGDLWKEKYGDKAYALSGGGIALLYFTIFAARDFYDLIPYFVAFVLYLLTAALSVWLAFRYKSLSLGALGMFGAYAAPIILGADHSRQEFLFTYLTLLNVAAIAICAKKFWVEILFIAFLGTAVDFAIWGARYSVQGNTLTSLYFIIVSLAVYVLGAAVLTRFHSETKKLSESMDRNLSLFNFLAGVFYCISIAVLLDRHFHSLLAPVALLAGILYFIAYVIVDRLELRLTNYALVFTGSAMLLASAAWYFDGRQLTLVMFGLGLLGGLLGTFLKREELRVAGVVLVMISLFKAFADPYAKTDIGLFVNVKFGLLCLHFVGLLLLGWLFKRTPLSDSEKDVPKVLFGIAAVLLWLAVSIDIAHYYSGTGNVNMRNLFLSLWWIVYAALLLIVGAMARQPLLRKMAIVLFGLSIIKVFLYDVQTLDTVYRIVAFIVLGVILLSVSFAYQKNKDKISKFIEGESVTS